jgi:restriction system protein
MTSETITGERVGQMLQVVFKELQAAGGVAPARELLDRAEPRLDLTPWELGHLETGAVRWRNAVQWYSVDCVKAGYIRKIAGKWHLTEDGEKALALPAGEFMRNANRAYREWKSNQNANREAISPVPSAAILDVEPEQAIIRQVTYDDVVEQAQTSIENHVRSLDPYQFQDLVGALLTGMGYHVPYIAKPGRDGGVDLIAYRDPLGTLAPRIKVQVKHRDQKMPVKEIRELEGLLRKEGDIGLLVSSGGFTSEVEREVRSAGKHIELMDLERLIALWQQHYDQIPETGRALLPLVRVFVLAPPEA